MLAAIFLSTIANSANRPNIIIIFTDDQGYADLGVHGIVNDIYTPNLDKLALSGVLCTSGYITAPQCTPSRVGLLTGQYQQRFGIDAIEDTPLTLEAKTIAEVLKPYGYTTGMVGKWHLDPSFSSKEWLKKNPEAIVHDVDNFFGRTISEEARLKYSPARQGFDEFYQNIPWWAHEGRWANYKADGSSLNPEGEWLTETTGDRLDDETAGALAFINRNHDRPFFLYLAYSGPHTPLEATPERLAMFPGEMPERRRVGLAMMATMDEGVGKMLKLLNEYGIEENTLIFFVSDNGAPEKMTKQDAPIKPGPDSPNPYNTGGWDGSLNDPHLGEKGMLTEGGIRVPFLVSWKGTLPSGLIYNHPVISLDIAPTIFAAAGIPEQENLDGKNLLPYLTGEKSSEPHKALYWRFWDQAAIRSGQWKLIHTGDGVDYLFDLSLPESEKRNLAEMRPEKVNELKTLLNNWTMEIHPPGIPENGLRRERGFYNFYLNHNEK
jgi:arylsulfatase A-like enzyme